MRRRTCFSAGALQSLARLFNFFILLWVFANPSAALAAGETNPTGISGVFNGNVNTACSYDPFTGNTTRSVSDIYVNGAVGVYPLSFTRTMNSRGGSGNPYAFGQAGSWSHNWQWSIDPVTLVSQTSANATPTEYVLHYADGRRVKFANYFQGNYIGADDQPDPFFRAAYLGVRDRFQQPPGHSSGAQNCYLLMPDGGKVWFIASHTAIDRGDGGPWDVSWTFQVAGLIDPYGQVTNINLDPTGASGIITEPAGRQLRFYKKTGPAGDAVVDRVEEWMTSAGPATRTVTYNYSLYNASGRNYSALTGVSYYDGTAAIYTYQNSNVTANARPLIKTCVDPMYSGPMWMIGYVFGGGVDGQIQSENYYDGTTIGAAVSTLTVTGTTTRTETRGDGPSRTFAYNDSNDPDKNKLSAFTDFKNHTASLDHDPGTGWVVSTTDFNGNQTAFIPNVFTGAVSRTTYPLTPSDNGTPAESKVVFSDTQCSDSNNQDLHYPYWVCTTTNGAHGQRKLGWNASYFRDTKKRVQTMTYLDGGSESFVYNNNFGQVIQHRMKTGGLETWTYDGRGLLKEYRDSYHLAQVDSQNPGIPASATPSVAYAYYTSGPNRDLVKTATDGRGNTATFTYNPRGQVLTTLLPGAANPITNTYNPNGNGTLVSVSDERLKVTSYTYDNYKRLRSITLPPPNGGASPPPTYTAYNQNFTNTDDYTHTDANVCLTISPTGKKVRILYDNNNRKQTVTVSPGANADPSFDQAVTSYTYDNNGNIKTVKDPNANESGGAAITTNWYDAQNRLTDVDDRMLNDPTVPHKNSKGHTVSYTYDEASNILTELRANGQSITYTPDVMNHVHIMSVPQTPNPTATTTYDYDGTGLMKTMHDPKGNVYTYGYDPMGRKSSLTYPTGGGSEAWTYDGAGNLGTFKNRSGSTQTFSYDARERSSGFSWNDGLTPAQGIAYDDVGHKVTTTSIYPSSNPIITVLDTYNDDNTLRSEEEWSRTENVHRTVNYNYNADLNRSAMTYPGSGGHTFSYSYTSRNQPYKVTDSTTGDIVRAFAYDHNENLTGYSINGTVLAQNMQFNPMDRMTHGEFAFANGTRTLDYTHNARNDRTSLTRDGSRENYGYDLNEQTTTGPEGTYSYDASGNRSGAGFGVNGLNQYTAFSGYTFGYDTRGNTTAIAAPTPTPPPVITTQPAPRTVTAGQTATFSVVASGAPPLSYQWRKNGSNIANAIAASYTTPATTLADNGALFSVLVSNPGGSTLSNGARLTVNPAPTPTPTPPPNKVLPVTFNPNSFRNQASPPGPLPVNLKTMTAGAVIYWTHNGSTPVPGNGTTFKINSNFGTVTVPGGNVWVLKAIAIKSGMTNSDVTTSGVYDNTDPNVAPPPGPDAPFVITGTATYTYDAQNRLSRATVNGVTETFLYDGLNRKFSQTISGTTTVNVWDGWNLIQEYDSGSNVPNYSYVYGVGGILERFGDFGTIYFFQDALGNTAYITDSSGTMIELYQYDRFGNVTVYGPGGALRSAPSYDIRHLYTGQLWMPQIGLYDLRNRVYSVMLHRFLQSDPASFGGDAANLYRYCGNNPHNIIDPSGLDNPSGTLFYNGPQDINSYRARYYNQNAAGYAATVNQIEFYNKLATGYNVISHSATLRLVYSVVELQHAVDLAAAAVGSAVVTKSPAISALLLAAASYEAAEAAEDIESGIRGEGYNGPTLPTYNLYAAGDGGIYVYDQNWNWVGEINFAAEGNGITDIYDANWNWIGSTSTNGDGGGGYGSTGSYSAGTGTYVGFGVVSGYGIVGSTGTRIPPQPVKKH